MGTLDGRVAVVAGATRAGGTRHCLHVGGGRGHGVLHGPKSPSTREIADMLTPSTLSATTVSNVARRCWRR